MILTSLTCQMLVQEVRRLEDAANKNEEELLNLSPGSSPENRGIRYIIPLTAHASSLGPTSDWLGREGHIFSGTLANSMPLPQTRWFLSGSLVSYLRTGLERTRMPFQEHSVPRSDQFL